MCGSHPEGIRRIVLIGYRATGKSTVGARLAQLCNWQYFSTDQIIAELAGRPIPEIVATEGWSVFREYERSAVRSLVRSYESVIDCGGGVVENGVILSELCTHSWIAWLDAPIEVVYQRMQGDPHRPLLGSTDMMEDIRTSYSRRLPLYNELADMRISTHHYTPEEVAEQLCRKIGK